METRGGSVTLTERERDGVGEWEEEHEEAAGNDTRHKKAAPTTRRVRPQTKEPAVARRWARNVIRARAWCPAQPQRKGRNRYAQEQIPSLLISLLVFRDALSAAGAMTTARSKAARRAGLDIEKKVRGRDNR